MKIEFTIPGRLEGLNEYTRACRAHWSRGNKMKQDQQEIVAWAIRAARPKPLREPVKVQITWLEKDLRRDWDNITFASKFIMDAIIEMGILPDDSRKWVREISHQIKLDRKDPRIEVTLTEDQTTQGGYT